jgi:hypothetical protein
MLEPNRAAGAWVHLAHRNLDAVPSEPAREVLGHGPRLEHELAIHRELVFVDQVSVVRGKRRLNISACS